jgi:hypothetical protein
VYYGPGWIQIISNSVLQRKSIAQHLPKAGSKSSKNLFKSIDTARYIKDFILITGVSSLQPSVL